MNKKPQKKGLGQCCKRVWGDSSFSSYQCSFKGTVIRDGKVYCTKHDPIYEKRKREERDKKWDKESRIAQEKFNRTRFSVAYCADLSVDELKSRVSKNERAI